MSDNSNQGGRLREGEFVLLTAFLISLVALSTDMMLPALPMIASDLGVAGDNSRQQVISVLFLGLTAGQLLYGPLSDQIGRKPTIVLGFSVFLAGCLISILARDFSVMLAGRLLQGLGVAALRVVIVAIVRDQYEGAAMARIVSLAMSVFIIVPCLAPLLGQVILSVAHWRMVFVALAALGFLLFLWFAWRQPETLPRSARGSRGLAVVARSLREVGGNRVTMGCALATGLLHGAFIAYLISSQQVFQDVFGVGDLFPLYFALLALALGGASLLNARLVTRVGTRRLSSGAITAFVIGTAPLLALCAVSKNQPPLWFFVATLAFNFFCLGLAIGNLNAIAMQPLGHIAGVAASVLHFLSGVVSLTVGWTVGALFDQSVLPLVTGFFLTGIAAMGMFRWSLARGTTDDARCT